jgi:DNA-directed RNA polymerase subunit beta'
MLRNSDGNLIAMGRSMAIQILDEKGTERSSQRVAYGSKIYVDDGDAVKRGQRLAEWDPYTRPMMTEVEGTVEFEDVVDGISVSNPPTRRPASPSVRSSTGVRRRAVPISSRQS